MAKADLTEQDVAGIGPIELKETGNPAWCWQTISHLQSLWNSLDIDLGLYEKTWAEAEEHRVWEKVPYEHPYGSKEQMLVSLEVGDVPAARARVAAKAMTVTPMRQHGGINGYNKEEGYVDNLPPNKRGKSSYYLTARIARDHPEIWERMKRGEFKTVAEAARAAGIKLAKPRKTVTLSDNVDRLAKRLVNHYSTEQVQQLREYLAGDATNG